MDRYSGIVPVLVTPVDERGEVDVNGLNKIVDYYQSKSVSGLWVLGTGGEDMGLSFDQRLLVAETVSKAVGDKMKLTVGASFYSVKESINFIKETAGMNFGAYHAMPYHPKVSPDQIENWYIKLAGCADKPFWAYTSGNWAQHISPKMIESLKSTGLFEGVKYSTSNAVDLQEVSYLNDSSFQVISAVIKTYYYSLCLGLEAATSVEATCFLDEIMNVEYQFRNHGPHAAYNAQKVLNELLKYPSPAASDNFLRVAELKYILSKRLDIGPYVTEYYRSLSNEEKLLIDSYFKK